MVQRGNGCECGFQCWHLRPASAMKMWWQPSQRRFGFADADVAIVDADADADVVIGAISNGIIDVKNINPAITYTLYHHA